MSGFGTKKPGSDFIQQLTFPTLYADYYAMEHEPLAYFPDPAMRPEALPVGHDLQAAYHEQKRIDANRRALAGVKDTATAKYRYLHSHQGYYNMPKPVLGQRKYANPSFGNQSDIYSARPAEAYVPIANMYGGVLYTAEAQRWGRQKMRERADQLNAIDVAQQGFLTGETLATAPMRVGVEVPEGALPESVSTKAKIELVATIEGILNAVDSGSITSITYSDVVKFLRLLFRWASGVDVEELKEVLEYVDYIETSILGLQNTLAEGADASERGKATATFGSDILEIMRKVREYLRRMIAVVNKSPAERKAASANFIKALGFTKTSLSAPSAEQMRQQMKDTQRAEAQAAALDDDDAYDYEDDEVFPPTRTRYAIGAETNQLMKKLNTEMGRNKIRYRRVGRPVAHFDPSVRERMGAANGAYEGEALQEGADIRVRNPMRNMAEAELQPEVVERGLEEAPVRAAPAAAGYTTPDYLTRDAIPKDARQIRQLLQRLNREGHGLYIPRDDTPVKTIRRRIIALWKL